MNACDEKACEGGRTITGWNADMEHCLHCDREVRWDLVDHPFFGFQTCEKMIKVAAAPAALETR